MTDKTKGGGKPPPANLPERPLPIGATLSPGPLPPEIVKIIEIFRTNAGIELSPRDIETLPHLLDMARSHPREFLDSDDYKNARKAMQTLVQAMPRLIDRAEALANTEAAAGRPAWLDHYAKDARALLVALEPFTLERRHRDGWWHGWARMIGVEIRLIFSRAGVPISYEQPTARAAKVMFDLLALIDDSIRPSDIKNIMRPEEK